MIEASDIFWLLFWCGVLAFGFYCRWGHGWARDGVKGWGSGA